MEVAPGLAGVTITKHLALTTEVYVSSQSAGGERSKVKMLALPPGTSFLGL